MFIFQHAGQDPETAYRQRCHEDGGIDGHHQRDNGQDHNDQPFPFPCFPFRARIFRHDWMGTARRDRWVIVLPLSPGGFLGRGILHGFFCFVLLRKVCHQLNRLLKALLVCMGIYLSYVDRRRRPVPKSDARAGGWSRLPPVSHLPGRMIRMLKLWSDLTQF